MLTFPDSSTIDVVVLSSTSYEFQATAYAPRVITGTNLNLADDTSAQITSPFPLFFDNTTFTTLFVSSNGHLNFAAPFDEWVNAALPSTLPSGHLIAPFWDDLVPGGLDNVFWATSGVAPTRELIVEWRNVHAFGCGTTAAITFQVVFFEDRRNILFNYGDVHFGDPCPARDQGASATVGIQTSSTVAAQFSFNTSTLYDNTALLWTLPAAALSGFTDDPLSVEVTRVKAVHITQLRTRINALRARFGLAALLVDGPVAWPRGHGARDSPDRVADGSAAGVLCGRAVRRRRSRTRRS